ncbi:MAG: hypothetical protein EBT09_02780 [Actinobacteria bacterium]|nr:hypothetical protein [Actinomycetota bacterium]
MLVLSDRVRTEFAAFLRSSSPIEERVSDELRPWIHIRTSLLDALERALNTGRSVVIAGTAGSGKTSLIRAAKLPESYRCILDLTATDRSEWDNLFTDGIATVVAGNEGAFLIGSASNVPGFSQVVSDLHDIQTGHRVHGDDSAVVIDAAGLDPAHDNSIGKMLRLPIVKDFVSQNGGEKTIAAWGMFDDDQVIGRLTLLVQAAAAAHGNEGFTFRQLWQFVGDLATAASSDIAWFERIFTREGTVCNRINEVFDQSRAALPQTGSLFWYDDHIRLSDRVVPKAVPALQSILDHLRQLRLGGSGARRSEEVLAYEQFRQFAIFGLKDSPLERLITEDASLWQHVIKEECAPFLRAINRYNTYGLLSIGTDLELWVDHRTERRTEKTDVQVSLGSAPSSEFIIRSSLLVANDRRDAPAISGCRRLLHHVPSGTSMVVTRDLTDGISSERSVRSKDRESVEYDWRIGRFLAAIAPRVSRPDHLRVAYFDFRRRSATFATWNIGQTIHKISG